MLLAEHAGASYVRPHLEGLRLDLRQAACWSTAKVPAPKNPIAGDLLSYSKSSGRIKVRYGPRDFRDFEMVAGAYEDPMHFQEPWTLKLEGTPDLLNRPRLLLITGDGEAIAFKLGVNHEDSPTY